MHQAPGHYRAPSPGTYHQAPHQVITVVERLINDHMSDLDIVENALEAVDHVQLLDLETSLLFKTAALLLSFVESLQ